MYHFTFYTHVAISLITMVAGIATLSLAYIGYRKGYEYSGWNRLLGRVYIVAIYFQLMLGLFMYYYPEIDIIMLEQSRIDPGNSPTIRFWEIEHAAIMVFALILVQIGCVFISKTKSSKKKYQLSFWYYGVPLLLMLFTMNMAMR